MKSENIKKSASEAIRDLFQQQQNIFNAYTLNPLRSVAVSLAATTALSKMTNVAIPRNYFNPAMMGQPSYFNDIQKTSKRFNGINSAIGFSNLDILLRQIPKESFNSTFQNIFSPAIQIQKSLSSLYSTKSAFANYSNLYSNAAFWGQFKELQSVISAIPKILVNTEFATDFEFDEDFNINEMLTETSTIAASIDNYKNVSYQDFEVLKSKVDAIYNFITSSKTQKTGLLYTLIIFLLFKFEPLLNDIVQQVQHYQDAQTNVSHEDIKELSDMIQQSMEEMRSLIVKYDYRLANYDCLLKIKNNTNTTTIYKIKKGDNLLVLQVNKKWLLVLIEDRTDNSQITGWVLKKYISKQYVGRALLKASNNKTK